MGALTEARQAALEETDRVGALARIRVAVALPLHPEPDPVARKFAAEHSRVIYKAFRGLLPGEDAHSRGIWASASAPALSTTPSQ
ncbi:hypothetical protein ACFYY1_41785 [Streptomyces sp. NPDC001890]|uniref:hypothetical protein n=1 Tax=Streptomyces sp. NPDC001890 TaxID=3364620 RepID=UPI00367B1E7C